MDFFGSFLLIRVNGLKKSNKIEMKIEFDN